VFEVSNASSFCISQEWERIIHETRPTVDTTTAMFPETQCIELANNLHALPILVLKRPIMQRLKSRVLQDTFSLIHSD
jgi:hypothetical protein